MNITIKTTQWGDTNQPIIRMAAEHRHKPIIRNMVMTFAILSLAGLMVIQIMSPSPNEVQTGVNDQAERSVEVVRGDDLLSAELMNAEDPLRPEINRGISLVNLGHPGILSK